MFPGKWEGGHAREGNVLQATDATFVSDKDEALLQLL